MPANRVAEGMDLTAIPIFSGDVIMSLQTVEGFVDALEHVVTSILNCSRGKGM